MEHVYRSRDYVKDTVKKLKGHFENRLKKLASKKYELITRIKEKKKIRGEKFEQVKLL